MLKFTMVDIFRMESKLQRWNYKNVKILWINFFFYEFDEFLNEHKTLIFRTLQFLSIFSPFVVNLVLKLKLNIFFPLILYLITLVIKISRNRKSKNP